MRNSSLLFDPVVLDGCGVFGVLRKSGSPKISSQLALKGIDAVRFRGSRFGAGFASFARDSNALSDYRLKVFVDDLETANSIRKMIMEYESEGLKIRREEPPRFDHGRRFGVWTVFVDSPSDALLASVVARINAEIKEDAEFRGRVFSSGRFVDIYKEVGYPLDVAKSSHLTEKDANADMWLAHTRQPTNSPGMYPIWSHPFASFECAIIHNGDISSFGANLQYVGAHGVTSLVGTDSEVIAYLLDHFLRVEKLTIEQAAIILSNPYERWINRLRDGTANNAIRTILNRHKSARLDGPFTVIAGYSDGYDTYMLGLIDRSKFRPIVIGEDEDNYYMASEECSIRAVSPDATVWTPEPGRYTLASTERGVIQSGRTLKELFFNQTSHIPNIVTIDDMAIDAVNLSYRELNDAINAKLRTGHEVHVKNVNGQRYIGVRAPANARLVLYGTAGNCLANYNNGAHIRLYGNAADDVADTMHSGRIIIHGDARDVLGQALQGGEIFVRGNAGNRAVIQMREYRDRQPFVIIGGRADDYFGEYMAGGVAIVLGLNSLGKDYDGQLVGDFVATGMVGGRIYIRGEVRRDNVGLAPPREDIVNYLKGLLLDNTITTELFSGVTKEDVINLDLLRSLLPVVAFARIRKLFEGKYTTPLTVATRKLQADDLVMVEDKLRSFIKEFGLNHQTLDQLKNEEFTIITPKPGTKIVDSSEKTAEE